MLQAILAHERERRDRRRQNNDGIRNADAYVYLQNDF